MFRYIWGISFIVCDIWFLIWLIKDRKEQKKLYGRNNNVEIIVMGFGMAILLALALWAFLDENFTEYIPIV